MVITPSTLRHRSDASRSAAPARSLGGKPPFDASPETFTCSRTGITEPCTLPTASTVSARRRLSMGMSEDFEVAVEEGATMVRLGTALFGARE